MRTVRWLALVAAALCGAGQAQGHEELATQVAEVTAALEEEPGSHALFLHRAELHRLQGDFERAGADYDRAGRLGADRDELLLGRAALAHAAGDPRGAMAQLDSYLRGLFRDSRALALRAEARLALGGDARAAAADLDRAIEYSTRPSPDLVLRRARLLAQLGRPGVKRALDALLDALRRWGPSAALEDEARAYAEALGRQTPAIPRDARRVTGIGRTAAGAAVTTARSARNGLLLSTPVVTRGPYLQVGTSHSVVVRWRTDVATEGVVRYGDSPGAGDFTVSDGTLLADHEVSLAGLAPSTHYYYSVGTGDSALAGGDSLHAFITGPPAGDRGALRLWVIGDSGLPGTNQRAVRDAWYAFAGERPATAWLMLGDNAYTSGTDAQYQSAVFDVYQDMLRTTPLWPTRGNHDLLHGGGDNDYYDIFTLPAAGEAGGAASGTEAWYAFDLGNVHLVCLDSYGSARTPGSPMLTWLQADLDGAAGASPPPEWILAFWHHPPYTRGSHDSDSETELIEMRENVLPILEAGGVDLVLTGHSHSYERSFLLDGHYGSSTTLADAMKIDEGDGRVEGDGIYRKLGGGPAAHAGAIYTVAGSSSRTSGGSLDHPVMVASLNVPGSVILDIEANRLDALFLDSDGEVRDDFTMVKGTPAPVAETPGHAAASLALRIEPTPATGAARLVFSLPRAASARLEVFDAAGRRSATLLDGWREAGDHVVEWSARDASGAALHPGVWFARLTAGGRARTEKIVLAP